MFGFGKRKIIEQRAKSLADLMLLLLDCLGRMTLPEVIEANHRRGFIDSYIEQDRSKGSETYGFFECEPESADFSFHIVYETQNRMLIAEGHGPYFGLVLSGSSGARAISADLKEALGGNVYGRDARALQKALLKYPGFESIEQVYERLGVQLG